MSAPLLGKKAPAFSLAGTGGDWSLKDGLGKNVVIYFYPGQYERLHRRRQTIFRPRRAVQKSRHSHLWNFGGQPEIA